MRYAGKGLSLSDFSTPGGGGSAGQAAGSGSKIADITASIAANAPRADEQAILALTERSKQKQGVMNADEAVHSQEKLLNAQLEAKKLENAAIEAAGKKKAGGEMLGKVIGTGIQLATAFSDATMKHDIEPLEDALTTLRNLKPVTFYYNEEYSSSPERLHHGFVAQEYKEVLPDATYYDESIGKLAIDTGDLIAILVSAVQTLESRVTHMEAKNALAGATR
jgi:hypothetical protein